MKQKATYLLPLSIVLAALIIAGSIIFIKKSDTTPVKNTADAAAAQPEVNIKPISTDDHILGNPNAPVKIVEYSDPSCPFCKIFNPTMVQIMDTYGKNGQVAWVYRSFPLDKPGTAGEGKILHPNAGHEAQALECAASLGGNDIFWAYEKKLYETTPSVTGATPNGLDQKQLPVIAAQVGLDKAAFTTCLDSGKMKDKVEAQYLEGINAGVSGTPYNFIVTSAGKKVIVPGALPFDQIKSAIDILLGNGSAN
jgi:protein-disulfide isomerase